MTISREPRVRLEAEAVLYILAACDAKQWEWVGSEAIALEVSRTPDPERRRRVQVLASRAPSQGRCGTARACSGGAIGEIAVLRVRCASSGLCRERRRDGLPDDGRQIASQSSRSRQRIAGASKANPLNMVERGGLKMSLTVNVMPLEQVRLVGLKALGAIWDRWGWCDSCSNSRPARRLHSGTSHLAWKANGTRAGRGARATAHNGCRMTNTYRQVRCQRINELRIRIDRQPG